MGIRVLKSGKEKPNGKHHKQVEIIQKNLKSVFALLYRDRRFEFDQAHHKKDTTWVVSFLWCA